MLQSSPREVDHATTSRLEPRQKRKQVWAMALFMEKSRGGKRGRGGKEEGITRRRRSELQ